jgi:asparagine synthase (glutamine-hydrolysing)
MCGIAGWLATRRRALAPELIEKMTDAIAHRGPDGSGSFHTRTQSGEHQIVLGHRRLAIIDPAGGQQPMFDHERGLALVFNGEIYNFWELRPQLERLGAGFRTACDTEVLLYAYKYWGTDCLRRLRGMFAFAIWDAGTDTLFLARDRFGKKPLFVYERDGFLAFASEIKALLTLAHVQQELDHSAVVNFFLYRYVPGPGTMFAKIRKLPPGAWALWKAGRVIEHIYYTAPDATSAPNPEQPADPVAVFKTKLDEAVRIRMISDVPFGVFLSGGLDSSTIAALMQRHLNHPVRSFSIGFAESRFSEAKFARRVANYLKTDHDELIVTPRQVLDELPKLIHLSDAPISEPASVMVYFLAVAASRSVKMVLTGEGADEVLAGYPKHLFEPYSRYYAKFIPRKLHRTVIQPMVSFLPPGYRRLKTLIASFGLYDPRERMPGWFGALTREQLKQLVSFHDLRCLDDERPFKVREGQSALRRICYFDQMSLLPDNLLERGDRMTMGASIEARMPFMDHELIETVASMSDNVRIRGRVQKWVLRQVAAQLLPQGIAERRKIGFSTPVRIWMRTEMRDFIYDHLTGPGSITRTLYNEPMLRAAIDDHVKGRQDHEKLIWTLLNFELFQRTYRLS